MHSHAHSHRGSTGTVLRWSLIATFAFAGVEVVGGIRAHSLALLSDAGHNVTDALALLLALVGYYLQAKPADEVKTFGYHRAGVLTAFLNAITLLVLSGWIFYESADRLRHPQAVEETLMIVVAGLGLVLNAVIMLALRAASRNDLNVRSAFIHMLGDALGSIAIVAGGIAIRYTGWERIDPLLSILIGSLIVWTTWDIVREALNILLEGLPKGLKLTDVTHAISEVKGVLGVHDLHIWSLGSAAHALCCHVRIEDVPPSASDEILQRLNRMLLERFHIAHTTVQFEHADCTVSSNGCVIPADVAEHHHHHHHHRG